MSETENRKTELVIVTGFIFLFLIFKAKALLYASCTLGAIFLFVPVLGERIVTLWLTLSHVLGKINAKILLSVVYIVFLVPLSLLYRLLSKDPLFIKPSDRRSFFRDRNHTYAAKDLENIW